MERGVWVEYALGLLGVLSLIALMATAISGITVTFYG